MASINLARDSTERTKAKEPSSRTRDSINALASEMERTNLNDEKTPTEALLVTGIDELYERAERAEASAEARSAALRRS